MSDEGHQHDVYYDYLRDQDKCRGCDLVLTPEEVQILVKLSLEYDV